MGDEVKVFEPDNQESVASSYVEEPQPFEIGETIKLDDFDTTYDDSSKLSISDEKVDLAFDELPQSEPSEPKIKQDVIDLDITELDL